jgi:hypothetical protein
MAPVKRSTPIVKKKPKIHLDEPKSGRILIPGPEDLNIPSDDFFEYFCLIYGTSGIGKTSLCSSAPGNLTCAFEPKRKNLSIRMLEFRSRTVPEMEQGASNPWKDFLQILEDAENDPTVTSITIDNIVRCYLCCENDFLLSENREFIPKDDFGYCRGQVNRAFGQVFNNLKSDSRLGCIFNCHSKETEVEFNSGTTDISYGPDVPAAVLTYMKTIMDFAFFYGWYNDKRAVHVRWPTIWTKCGTGFLTPNNVPLKAFEVPEVIPGITDPLIQFETLTKAFHNELYDCTIPLEDQQGSTPSKKKPLRRSV